MKTKPMINKTGARRTVKSKTQNRLRIAMLGHKRIPSREGGIEVVVEEIATRMVKKGHSVVCYNRLGHHVAGEEFDTERLSDYMGVRCIDVFTINRKGLAAMTSSVLGAIRGVVGKYDVVHFYAEEPAFMWQLPKVYPKASVRKLQAKMIEKLMENELYAA